ncbi:MAG TPA: TfoX/Sxy family protein, partial [Thermoanaerobaculia bacterium]
MPVPNPFVQHLIDQMDNFGLVEAKPMFGGFGLYHKGLMFGLVADDTLYLKVDDGNRPRFEAAGCRPFVYQGKGGSGPVGMSYFRATDEALEDPEELADWARSGYEAALRSKNGKGGGGGGAGRRPGRGGGGRQNGSRPHQEVGPMQPRSPLPGPGGVPIQIQSQGQGQGQGQGQDQQRTGQRPGRR